MILVGDDPDQAAEIGSIMYMYMNGGEPGDFDRLVNWNFTQANIIVLFKDHKADTISEGIHASKEFIQNHPSKAFASGSAGSDRPHGSDQ